MKKLAVGMLLGAGAVLTLSAAPAQEPKIYTETFEMIPGDPDSVKLVSPNMKYLSDGVAFRLHNDGYGVRRATLMVLVDDDWEPVAVDGLDALLPPAIPVR